MAAMANAAPTTTKSTTRWSKEAILTLVGVIVAVLGILIGIISPRGRQWVCSLFKRTREHTLTSSTSPHILTPPAHRPLQCQTRRDTPPASKHRTPTTSQFRRILDIPRVQQVPPVTHTDGPLSLGITLPIQKKASSCFIITKKKSHLSLLSIAIEKKKDDIHMLPTCTFILFLLSYFPIYPFISCTFIFSLILSHLSVHIYPPTAIDLIIISLLRSSTMHTHSPIPV
jgi:hypothetical protein